MSKMPDAGKDSVTERGGVLKIEGPVLQVDRDEFITVLSKTYKAYVYHTKKGLFGSGHRYAVNWEGMTYYTDTKKPFEFTDYIRVVKVRKITLP